MKTRRVVGYVAVAFAWATGCSGSSGPSGFAPTGHHGGAADAGGRALAVIDARAGDETDVDSGASEGGAADGTTNAGTTNAVPGSSSSEHCCVSGAYYVCSDPDASPQCPSACTHDPSKDATCTWFDAGSSRSDASAPRTNACGGFFPGFACLVGGGCLDGTHCTGNECYPNDVGNPCTYGTDCGDGNHCTAGCCASPATGSACDAFWDCKSGTCTNGVCQ